MSEQKTFQTSQYIPLTIGEIKSAADNGNGTFESENGIQFTTIETVGVVQSVKSKEDGGVTIAVGTSFKPTPDVLYAFSGKYTDETVVNAMNQLVPYSIVILRGKFTAYMKDNESRQGINPHQIISLDSTGGKDVRTRELWFYKLLSARIANRFPILVGDDVHGILTREGIPSTPEGGTMVIVNPSAFVGGSVVPVQKPSVKPTPVAASPAPKPAMPEKIATQKPVTKPVEKPDDDKETTEIVGKIVDTIVDNSGADRDEILGEITDMSKGGLMPLLASAIECAKIHDTDVASLLPNRAAKPTKPASKPASKPIKKPAEKPVEKPAEGSTSSTREKLINAIVQAGFSREEIDKRTKENLAKFKGMIDEDSALVMLADKLNVSLPAASPASKPVMEPLANKVPSKKATKPAKELAKQHSEQDVANEIIGYLDEHGGKANITELYTSFQGKGMESNISEAAIITLQGNGKILIDGETVSKT